MGGAVRGSGATPADLLNGGVTYLNVARQERLFFPGGFCFDVRNGASSTYVVTLRYYRNDFNTITRIGVVDEREDVAAVLAGRATTTDQVRPRC